MNRANRILKSKDKNLLIPRFTMHRNATQLCFKYTVDSVPRSISNGHGRTSQVFFITASFQSI